MVKGFRHWPHPGKRQQVVVAVLSLAVWSAVAATIAGIIHFPELVDVAILAALVCSIAFWGGYILWERRLARHVRAVRYLLCPKCRYDLHAMPRESRNCPECGMYLTLEDAELFWRSWVAQTTGKGGIDIG